MNVQIKYVDDRTVEFANGLRIYANAETEQRYRGLLGLAALTQVLAAYQRDGDFRSFRPQPKYRPWTPKEAVAALNPGETNLLNKEGDRMRVYGFIWTQWAFKVAVDCHHPEYTCADLLEYFQQPSGSPCGVEETP